MTEAPSPTVESASVVWGPITAPAAILVAPRRYEPGSIVAGLFGARAVTNSWHHQAVDRCGAGLVVTGRTADGVVEAVELPDAPVLGVQWHPEDRIGCKADRRLFESFARAVVGT